MCYPFIFNIRHGWASWGYLYLLTYFCLPSWLTKYFQGFIFVSLYLLYYDVVQVLHRKILVNNCLFRQLFGATPSLVDNSFVIENIMKLFLISIFFQRHLKNKCSTIILSICFLEIRTPLKILFLSLELLI